jgi:hypothetical protein
LLTPRISNMAVITLKSRKAGRRERRLPKDFAQSNCDFL